MNVFARFLRRNDLSCQHVEKVMQEYLDNELDPAEVPKVLKHLETCRDCGLEAELYERIKTTLRGHQQTPDQASIDRVRNLAFELANSGLPSDE